MRNPSLPAVTAIAPALWGTTYLVTTELLPPGRPLLAGTLRALPAGLLLLAAVGALARRRPLPGGAWWWRAAVLGTLNIGLFFALLFVAAYRLPGGVAAVLGAIGPFVVAALAFGLFGVRPGGRVLIAGAAGLAGVGLLVLRSTTALDPIGLAAAAGGMVSMSFGTVLGRHWGVPDGFADRRTALLALTGWQLTVGGLLLAPAALLVEGLPGAISWTNVAGFGYLSLVGTAAAYFLWFRGVTALAPARVTLLGLLSPVGAAALGWLFLGQALSAGQLLGAAAVLGAVLLGTTTKRTTTKRTTTATAQQTTTTATAQQTTAATAQQTTAAAAQQTTTTAVAGEQRAAGAAQRTTSGNVNKTTVPKCTSGGLRPVTAAP